MRAIHVAALACAVLAADLATVIEAGAQGANVTGFGRGNRRPGGEDEKKPQYIPSEKPTEKVFPLDSTWTAVSLNGKPFTGRDRPTFSLDQQYRAKGFGGCNTYSATSYPLREQRIAVGPFALTRKQCEKDVMESERAFLVALRTSQQWDLEGSTLVIKTQSGELRMERSI